jgi:hypothetical protein
MIHSKNQILKNLEEQLSRDSLEVLLRPARSRINSTENEFGMRMRSSKPYDGRNLRDVCDEIVMGLKLETLTSANISETQKQLMIGLQEESDGKLKALGRRWRLFLYGVLLDLFLFAVSITLIVFTFYSIAAVSIAVSIIYGLWVLLIFKLRQSDMPQILTRLNDLLILERARVEMVELEKSED